ncbi:putative ctr copper transporter family protein [Lyophyllum shimeji]|uniref:Copper transport protein n=1 Tax=Lyophyllum shimeji TaxID=47721 RepID=A0A9P3PIS2_LYOSH|nr:putative ctr copper transporter family protein [Lyophyllum shimeji]
MDHGGNGGHDMPRCSMHMLWNTQIIDTCIVFPAWHIRSYGGFALSFLAIVALGIFYEYLREIQKRYDAHVARTLGAGKGKGRRTSASPSSGRSSPDRGDYEESGRRMLKPSSLGGGAPVPIVPRVVRAVLYGATVFLSFFLMLVFMTYNAYLIVAVVLGAALGHYIFGASLDVDAPPGRAMACH